MTTDIVGFPKFSVKQEERLDRSLLGARGPMQVSFGFRLAIRCKFCKSDVPVNGVTDQVTCADCGRLTELDQKWWQLDEEWLTQAFSYPVGGGIRRGGVRYDLPLMYRLRRQPPHCHGCQQPFPEAIVDQIFDAALAGEAASAACPGCGAPVPVRPADEQVRSLCPPALAVVSETLAEEAKGLEGVREFYVIARVDDATRWYWLLAHHAIRNDDLDGVRLPAETLERLAERSGWDLRAIAAAGEETPGEILARLAIDKDNHVRLAVAQNPRVPASVLPRLATDDWAKVRLAVARHPRTPIATILKLATDSDSEVREVVCRRRDRAWEETAQCPVCGSEGFGQRAPCPSCGARQVVLSPDPEEGRSGADIDLRPLVQLGGEVAAPDAQGFDLSLPNGHQVRVRVQDQSQQLEQGERVELLGVVTVEFDERIGGERLAAHQIPVVHARVVTSGADAVEQMARAIAELEGGRLIPMPPGLRISYEAPASSAWRLRLTARIRIARGLVDAWPLLLPVPLVALFLAVTAGLNGVTLAALGFFALLFGYSAVAIYLNKPCVTVDARVLSVTPWPAPWRGAKSVATDRVAQVLCRREVNDEYSLWAELTDGEKRQLTEGRYELEELFFIKRAVETVLGIQDRPVDGEARPFGPHDRLALPAALKPASS